MAELKEGNVTTKIKEIKESSKPKPPPPLNTHRCPYWDSGWCYNKDLNYTGCVGKENCVLYKEDE